MKQLSNSLKVGAAQRQRLSFQPSLSRTLSFYHHITFEVDPST